MKHEAFTLIELLISMALVTILSLIGFINLFGYRQNQDLKNAASGVVAVLRNAQSRSALGEEGARWGVYFDNTSSTAGFYDLFSGFSYATTSVSAHNVLPRNVQFNLPGPGSSSTVVFSPVGGLPNASTTIKVSLVGDPSVSSTIFVNDNGQIQY